MEPITILLLLAITPFAYKKITGTGEKQTKAKVATYRSETFKYKKELLSAELRLDETIESLIDIEKMIEIEKNDIDSKRMKLLISAKESGVEARTAGRDTKRHLENKIRKREEISQWNDMVAE